MFGFPYRCTIVLPQDNRAACAPDFTRQDNISFIDDARHSENPDDVSRADFKIHVREEFLGTDLYFHDTIFRLKREVHQTIDKMPFACNHSFKYALRLHVVAAGVPVIEALRGGTERVSCG